jgi:alanyl aminopeptidase
MQLRIAFLVATIGCGAGAAPRAAPQAAGSPSEHPDAAPGLRLPRTFVPTAYAVRIAVVPSETQFTGHVEIDGELASPSRVIWLDAQELTFGAAVAVTAAGRTVLQAVASPSGVVALRAPAALPAGHVALSIDYRGAISSEAPEGVFRLQSGGAWYAFTQFEATSARRAFPCFDEPDVKVPWRLTLDVPAGMVALANAPVESDTPAAGGATHTVVFARTRPLPSYLVAFAVGPFDIVDAPPTRRGTPVRIVVPHGQAAAAAGARDDTGALVARLEDYLGSPYPYDKLDIVAVPGFPGAMENAGLITFAENALLEDPAQPTIAHRRSFTRTAAHELAHQWFGDLVTLAWWDDTWLNEAFATWMSAKIVDQWQPGWGGAFDAIGQKASAMASDQLATARKIRQPIADIGDIGAAFDDITYNKGASVLRMFERWIGPDAFQRGVRAYLAAHAWRSATSSDFLAALGQAAGRDIAGAFSTFLDQAGTPLVTVALRCTAGAPPTVELRQQRYRPVGGQKLDEAARAERWQFPVCIRYPTGSASARDCTLLDAPTAELPLSHAAGCPAWVAPNSDAVGYYRIAFEGNLLPQLIAHLGELSAAERAGLVGDVEALVAAGRLPAGDALALVAPLGSDADRHVVAAAIELADQAGAVIDEADRPRYQRFVRHALGGRARTLGWAGKPGDTEDTRLLRASLVGFVADAGQDPALLAGATHLAWAWLDDHHAAPSDVADGALAVAARRDDRKLHARLVAEVRRATDASERSRYMTALGEFADPALVAATLDLVLSGAISLFEGGRAFLGDHTPAQRRSIYQAFKAHYDALAALLPGEFVPQLSQVGFVLCEPALRDDVAQFFRGRLSGVPGGPRMLATGVERMDSCLARRSAAQPSIHAFLAAQ